MIWSYIVGLLCYLSTVQIPDARFVDLLDFAIFSGDVLFMTLNLFCKLCERVCNMKGNKLCAKFHCNLFFLVFFCFGETVSDSVSEIWLNNAKYINK